jgi:carbamate kinase
MILKGTLVVALGGNAISRESEEGNVDQQFANSRQTARQLADLVAEGWCLAVTHGNGPQIGNFLLRNEAAAGLIYPLPMEVAVAHVQGGMGYMIAQVLTNELRDRGIDRHVTAVVTSVLVDENDPAFSDPTKPVGRVLTRQEADAFQRDGGWRVKEVAPGKFRRVVPSPEPRRILEIATIRRAVQAGDLVVTCGGGGVPVTWNPRAGFQGTRAVVDKDLASALLAVELQADRFLILTAVDRVAIDYGKPTQRSIEHMSLAEAQQWQDAGQFPPGSMGPKIDGAIRFLRQAKVSSSEAIIAPLDRACDAVHGRAGTRITIH